MFFQQNFQLFEQFQTICFILNQYALNFYFKSAPFDTLSLLFCVFEIPLFCIKHQNKIIKTFFIIFKFPFICYRCVTSYVLSQLIDNDKLSFARVLREITAKKSDKKIGLWPNFSSPIFDCGLILCLVTRPNQVHKKDKTTTIKLHTSLDLERNEKCCIFSLRISHSTAEKLSGSRGK